MNHFTTETFHGAETKYPRLTPVRVLGNVARFQSIIKIQFADDPNIYWAPARVVAERMTKAEVQS